MTKAEPKVVIVGRPNVGKSTLFNRLFGKRRSLVHNEPGVTRDRIEERTKWWVRAREFPVTLIDTGGLGGDRFGEEIDRQVEIALSQADVVLFLLDGQSGLTAADEDVVRRLQKSGVMSKLPVIGVVNKVDHESHESMITDFYSIGFDRVLTVSAEHGRGMDDLQEAIADSLGFFDAEGPTGATPEEEVPHTPRIAIVGRPNVGKSTLVNAISGQDRMITSPIAGTTIDAVDSIAELGGRNYILIDTAGIRRKGKTEQGVEVLSVIQARKALERCDVAILLLDGEAGIIDQDEKIGSIIEEVGCGVILGVNKWDTQRNNPKFTKEMAADRIRGKMAYLKYAPMLFLSAKRGEGYEDLGDLVDEILNQRSIRIKTKEFTEWVRAESEIHNPHGARFYMCHQAGKNPPSFVCHVNEPDKIDFSLKRHLINAIRERWGFMGSPLRMHFIKGKNLDR